MLFYRFNHLKFLPDMKVTAQMNYIPHKNMIYKLLHITLKKFRHPASWIYEPSRRKTKDNSNSKICENVNWEHMTTPKEVKLNVIMVTWFH